MKKLYIPLPSDEGRKDLLVTLLRKNQNTLTSDDIGRIVVKTKGFSGADMKNLCTEAALGPIRDIGSSIANIQETDVPSITNGHFESALRFVKPSVAPKEIDQYLTWNSDFGTFPDLL